MSVRSQVLELCAEAVKDGARKKFVCEVLDINIRTVQRWENNLRDDMRKNNRFSKSNALSKKEIKDVLDVVCSPRFRDLSPNQIVPILAENGMYYASESTMYRILNREGLLTHRTQSRVPERTKPKELKATGPNQVWTWDISYLRTYINGVYMYLYLILDIWDRSIVGWNIHESENGSLAAELLRRSCMENEVVSGKLAVHNDNGGPMISCEFLSELSRWGRASYSRPGVSDDNPFSESLFRTCKYHPGYPQAFESAVDACEWMSKFVQWYNHEHRHSGIGFVTPMQKRLGEDMAIMKKRIHTYETACASHPERWSRNTRRWKAVTEVILNPAKRKKDRQEIAA